MADLVAVACVVDSSLDVLAQWQPLLQEYISPLLQRLHELHNARQFRIGFVCYAPAATRPNPLLSKTFFGAPQAVVRELREEPSKFGIGKTGLGGGRGMAALEGLVAAIELFDILKESVEGAVCYLIHVAASPPDSAERPLWNISPRLDSASWVTLPGELRKRDIHYSNILLREIPRLSEFHATAATATQNPWFHVRPSHHIHLSGYPTQKGTKRTAEGIERSPEQKRARVHPTGTQVSPKGANAQAAHATSKIANAKSSPANSTPKSSNATPRPANGTPKLASAKAVNATPKAANATPKMGNATVTPKAANATPKPANATPKSAPPPAAPPAPGPSSNANGPPNAPTMPLQALVERLRAGEAVMQQKLKQAEAHEAAGRAQEAAALRQQVQQQLPQFQQLKQFMHAQFMKAKQSQQNQAQAQGQAEAAGSQEGPGQAQQQPSVPAHAGEPPAPAQIEGPAGASSVGHPSAQGNLQGPPQPGPAPPQTSPRAMHLPANVPPQMAAQMQKMIESRNRVAAPPPPAPPSNAPTVEHAVAGGGAGPQAVQGQGQGHEGQPVWRGTLAWSGQEAGMRKEMSTQVFVPAAAAAAAAHSNEHMQPDTWPTKLTLAPSNDKAVPSLILQEWIKRHKAWVFLLTLQTQSGDSKANEDNYKALVRLLSEKNIYALAAWPNSAGTLENRMLIFQLKNSGLAGAYFPHGSGVPELPKSQVCGMELSNLPPALALWLSKMGPEQQASLMQIPPDRRMMWMQSTLMRHQQALQQQQSQAQQQQQPQQQPQHQQQLSPQHLQQQQQQQQQQSLHQPQQAQQQQQLLQQSQPPQQATQPHAPPQMPKPGGQPPLNRPPGVFNPFLGGPPNIQTYLNLNSMTGGAPPPLPPAAGQMNAHQGMMNFNMGQVPMHQRNGGGMPVPGPGPGPGPGTAGLSFEMLQSFMQRNQDGSGANAGPGMG